MKFEFTAPQTEFEKLVGGHVCINAWGGIERGDEVIFQKFLSLTKPPPGTVIYIDSGGGDVEAAMTIGNLIRSSWFSTSIGKYVLRHCESDELMIPRELIPGQCMSAATLLFLAGRLRYFPDKSKFGVHQFSFQDPLPKNIDQSQILSAKIARYINDMNIASEFLEISSSTPNTQIQLIDKNRLRQMRVVTDGVTDVEWTVQSRGNMTYVRGERDSLYGHHKVMLCYSKESGFAFMSTIESQGREDEIIRFNNVEIVINEDGIRIDISKRCIRKIYGIYVNVISFISQEEAKLISNSNSFGIQIRASREAELFLGISAMSTEGGKDKLKSFYAALCDKA